MTPPHPAAQEHIQNTPAHTQRQRIMKKMAKKENGYNFQKKKGYEEMSERSRNKGE